MPRAKTLKLNEGVNLFNLNTGKTRLARIRVELIGKHISVKPILLRGESVNVSVK